MSKLLFTLSFLLLTGCATTEVKEFTPFVPSVQLKNSSTLVTFYNTLQECRADAVEYLDGKTSISPVDVSKKGLQQGLSNLGTGVVNPVIPGLYSLGGASGEVLDELGLNSVSGKKIVAWCMKDHGDQTKLWTVYDLNL